MPHWGWGMLPLLAAVWTRGLWAPDEPRRAQVARELLESGDFLVLRLCGELYPDKPPLFYWLIGALGSGLGWEVGVLRLLPLAGVAVTAWCVSRWAADWGGPLAGRLAPWAMLNSVMLLYQGQRLQIDPLLMGTTTVALWWSAGLLGLKGAWPGRASGQPTHTDRSAACTRPGAGRLVAVLGLGALGGVGGLLKGPVAWLWMALVPLLWWGITPAESGRRPLPWRALGGVVFLAVAPVGLWAWAVAEQHPSLFDALFFDQHLGRVVSGIHHQRPPWYYLGPVVLVMLPWTYPFVLGVWVGMKRRHPWAVWCVGLLAVFSCIPTKRMVYLLPMCPGCALVCGAWWAANLERGAMRCAPGLFHYPVALALLCAALGLFGLPLWLPLVGAAPPGPTVSGGWPAAVFLGGVLLGVALFLQVSHHRGDLWRWTRTLLWGWTASALAVVMILQPALDPVKSTEGLSRWLAARPERPVRIPCMEVDPAGLRFYGADLGLGSAVGETEDLYPHLQREGSQFLAVVRAEVWGRFSRDYQAHFQVLHATRLGGKEVFVLGAAD